MLTSKQRAFLRGKANTLESIVQVGKGGIGAPLLAQVSDALEARELVKGNVLPGCEQDAKAVANELADRVEAQVVQVIGKRFVLYKPSLHNPQIDLPK